PDAEMLRDAAHGQPVEPLGEGELVGDLDGGRDDPVEAERGRPSPLRPGPVAPQQLEARIQVAAVARLLRHLPSRRSVHGTGRCRCPKSYRGDLEYAVR